MILTSDELFVGRVATLDLLASRLRDKSSVVAMDCSMSGGLDSNCLGRLREVQSLAVMISQGIGNVLLDHEFKRVTGQ